MRKKFIIGMLTFVMAFSGIGVPMNCTLLSAHAAETGMQSGVINFGRGTASITIQGNTGQTLIGKRFNIYKLFHAENSAHGESVNYTFNSEYKTALQNLVGKALLKTPSQVTEYEVIDYIQTMNSNEVEGADASQTLEGRYSDFRYFVEDLRDEIVRLGNTSDTVTVTSVSNNNSIQIAGLEYGYYIVDEVSDNEGTHSASSLCMVSTANPNASVNMKSDYPSVVKKIQEDDHKDSIGNNGWNDIGDFEIGQIVPYKFESNVPNMNGYHTYYYAWHDVMDDALTFNKNSVSISISNGTKDYVLKADEFIISENTDGETFKVEIHDLKEIVDREFDNMDALGHNTYGQTVILTYNAILNDNAANDTGRPGFENDVRLEFSNDPDVTGEGNTGFTPWDTVVCFTYKLNVLKTNNHDQPLENAKFRLYSDTDCTEEVYVKKAENGYHVINRDTSGDTTPDNAVEMSSQEDGTFIIYGLDQGIYYLKETDAPDGYRAILDPIVLTVEPTFTADRNNYVKGDGATEKTLQNLEYSAYIKQFLSGTYTENHNTLETDVKEGSGNLTVINQVGTKLPVTGSSAMLVLLTLGAGVMLVAKVIPSEKKKKS
ncbi:MAG: isopeptide-forming domain-containing fimbrial protein [bacterium]|nr:isopeptide-forming domain-containing fimbrial protein [bacterium]